MGVEDALCPCQEPPPPPPIPSFSYPPPPPPPQPPPTGRISNGCDGFALFFPLWLSAIKAFSDKLNSAYINTRTQLWFSLAEVHHLLKYSQKSVLVLFDISQLRTCSVRQV